MKNRTLKIGIILIVAGLILLPVFQVVYNEEFPGTQLFSATNYTHESNGMYIVHLPANITSTRTTYFVIQWAGNLTGYSLVPMNRVNDISTYNFTQYNVAIPTISGNVSSGYVSIIYRDVPAGSYAFVELNQSAQSVYIAPSHYPEFTLTPNIAILVVIIGVSVVLMGQYERKRDSK